MTHLDPFGTTDAHRRAAAIARSTTGEIDTVVVAFTDMQGRLQGKRLHAEYFLDEVLAHGTEGCNYLLAVDVDMNTVDGYAMSLLGARATATCCSMPDLDTLRRLPPWQPGTRDGPGRPDLARRQRRYAQSPRADPAAPARPGWPSTGCRASPAPSWSSSCSATPTRRPGTRGYRDLTPANQYNVDYSMLGTTRVEPLLRDIRNDDVRAPG